MDQIFIGRGVGYLGNGATNIIFPLVVFALSFALMIGDGASSFFSLRLGEKKKEEASKGIGNAIVFGTIISIIICVLSIVFLPQIITIFGTTDSIRPYALEYGYIISVGFIFMIMGTILSSIIRADGSPKYSMISMVAGALLNIVGDPIFIFTFKMGIKGAAWATILSQLLTLVINLVYLKKFKLIKLDKSSFKLDHKTINKILALGISSFITQFNIVIVITAENNLLNKYGAVSKYGADIPITVLGIVMKINQILNSVIVGIAVGSQPIIGYNYGAKRIDRVKETFKLVLKITISVSAIATILFQLIPDKLIAIFGKGNELYTEFACMAFRKYLLLVIVAGFQIPTSIFFQAIGESKKSAIISLSRQLLFLVPSMILFGAWWGIDGILYSGPFADGLAFIVTLILFIKQLNIFKKQEKQYSGEFATEGANLGDITPFAEDIKQKDLNNKQIKSKSLQTLY